MSSAAFLVLSVVVGAASAALAWSHARRVRSATEIDTGELERAMKRVPEAQRPAELLERTRAGTWEHELAAGVLAARDPEAKLAVVNEALGEAEHRLTQGAGWPRAGIRIALLAAALLGASCYLLERDQIKWSLAIVLTGGIAALASVEAGRSAERSAEAQRRAIDRLVATTIGGLEVGSPERRGNLPRTDRRSRRRGTRS